MSSVSNNHQTGGGNQVDDHVTFDFTDSVARVVVLADVVIHVNGVIAFSSGVGQNGYIVTFTEITHGYHFDIESPVLWDVNSTVVVVVDGNDFHYPSVATISDASIDIGDPATITPVVTNVDGFALTFSVVGTLPDGLSIDTSTGVISGTPISVQSESLKIRVSFSDGFIDSNTFTLSIVASEILIFGSSFTTGSPRVANSVTLDGHTVTAAVSDRPYCWIGALDVASHLVTSVWRCASAHCTFIRANSVVVDVDGSFALDFFAKDFNNADGVALFSKIDQVTPTLVLLDGVNQSTAVGRRIVARYDASGTLTWARILLATDAVDDGFWGAVDKLVRKGSTVIVSGLYDVHASTTTLNVTDGTTTEVLGNNISVAATIFATQFASLDWATGAAVAQAAPGATQRTANANAADAHTIVLFPSSSVGLAAPSDRSAVTFQFQDATGTPTSGRGIWGQGETGEVQSIPPATHYELFTASYDSGFFLEWVAHILTSSGRTFTGKADCFDSAGNLYTVGTCDAGGAGSISANSPGFTTPIVTATHKAAGAFGFVVKRNAAGAAQWIKADGPSSTWATIWTDVVCIGTDIFVCGMSNNNSGNLILDEGLGTQVTIVGQDGVSTTGTTAATHWIAKLDPTDGHVIAVQKINGPGQDTSGSVGNGANTNQGFIGMRMFEVNGLLAVVFEGPLPHTMRFDPGGAHQTDVVALNSQANGVLALYDTALTLLAARSVASSNAAGNFFIEGVGRR